MNTIIKLAIYDLGFSLGGMVGLCEAIIVAAMVLSASKQ